MRPPTPRQKDTLDVFSPRVHYTLSSSRTIRLDPGSVAEKSLFNSQGYEVKFGLSRRNNYRPVASPRPAILAKDSRGWSP